MKKMILQENATKNIFILATILDFLENLIIRGLNE